MEKAGGPLISVGLFPKAHGVVPPGLVVDSAVITSGSHLLTQTPVVGEFA